MRSSTLMVGLLFGVLAQCAFAFDGSVDTTFGTNGQVAIVRPNATYGAGDKATGDLDVLPDGRFLWAAPLDDGSVWVGRAWRDGSPDITFGVGGNGRVTLTACGQHQRDVRLVNDGASGAYVWSNRCLRHILADGTLDPAFGLGAMPPESFFVADLARDPLGRFVLAGREGQVAKIYRFDGTGAADATFGNGGSVDVATPSSSWKEVNALVIRPDGRLVLGGASRVNMVWTLAIAQLLTDGTPDTSFSDDGFFELTAPPGFHTTNTTALALDSDESIVAVGRGNSGSVSCCILLTRLDSVGAVVPASGVKLFPLAGLPGLNAFGEQRDGLEILPNHRIVVGALSSFVDALTNHRTRYTLIRTFPDGQLDSSFGANGFNTYTILKPGSNVGLGDYNQMHAIGYDAEDGSMVILGRTFFEDAGTSDDYVSMVRARFDLIFDSGFD